MKLKSIFKKSIRSILRNKSSYISCIMVLGLGVLVLISMLSISIELKGGIKDYYAINNFGDGFATVNQMPKSDLQKLKGINGINEVSGTLTETVKANIKGWHKITTVKLVGVDLENPININKYSYIGNNLKNKNDIWLGKAFYDNHKFGIGDTISLLINGKYENFTIQGTIKSPEYITIVSETALIPDESTFTIGFIKSSSLEEYISKKGIVNNVSFTIKDGFKYGDVEKSVSDVLSKYGLLNLTSRKNQRSNNFVNSDINQLGSMGTILPFMFMVVTIIMLSMMLKRLIEKEREEIGTFKAFGYSNGELMIGYLMYGLIVGFAGFSLGLVFAYPFGSQMYIPYKHTYSLPNSNFVIPTFICLYALAISVGVSIFSVLIGVASVIGVSPAEAMRQKAPSSGKSKINFKGKFFNLFFNKTGIVSLRSIMRNKTRSFLIIISVLASFTLINLIYGINIAVANTLTGSTFTEHYDVKASFNKAKPVVDILEETNKIDGVISSQGLLTIPAELEYKNFKKDMMIYGIKHNSNFLKIRSTDGIYIIPPKNGIILNKKMAEKLHVNKGDVIKIKSSSLKEDAYITVYNIFEEAIGPGCYMDMDTLSSLFYNEQMANNILIKGQSDKINLIENKLTDSPYITDIVDTLSEAKSNKKNMGSMHIMIYSFIIMSFLMGFGAIFNVSRISLEEKQRELATMRILGYTVEETASLNNFEQWLMLFIGVILGFISLYFLKDYMTSMFSADFYTLKIHVTLEATIIAIACCILAVLLSNISAKKVIKNYNLADVLKERE